MSTAIANPPASTTRASTEIWYTRCPVPTAFTLALQLGLFDEEFAGEEGVNFRSLQESGDAQIYQSHFTHTQHNSFRHGGNVPALWARATGADTKLIGLSWVTTPHPILALPGSGIKTVADLKGKRLLVARRTRETAVDFWRATTLRIYETALATVGLTLNDVKLVEVPVEALHVDPVAVAESRNRSLFSARTRRGRHRESVFALIRGEVDVIPGQSSWSTELAALLGAHVVYDVGRQHPDKVARANNALPEALTVSGQFIDEHPDLVARVVARVLEASEWAKSNHDQALRFIAREQGVAEEITELTYGPELSQTFDVDFNDEKVAAIRSQKEFLLKNGFLPKDFDLDQWIDPRPLQAARHILAKRRKELEGSADSRVSAAKRPVPAAASCSL